MNTIALGILICMRESDEMPVAYGSRDLSYISILFNIPMIPKLELEDIYNTSK